MFKNKHVPWVVAAGVALSLAAVIPVFAATSAPAVSTGAPANGGWGAGRGGGMRGGVMMGKMPGVFGTVSAVNGATLTVTQMMRPNSTTTATVYIVDATSAKVMKNGTSSTVSAIATGDMVMVQGTVTGDNVTATVIRDGLGGMMGGRGMAMKGGFGHGATSSSARPTMTPPIQGNGEPVVGGSIAAINGETLTVTNASNVTYTIDVTNAKIVKNGTTTAVTALATGDSVVVQGAVNGTSIAASSVLDQGPSTATPGAPSANSHPSIFGAIGSFFKHIFGF